MKEKKNPKTGTQTILMKFIDEMACGIFRVSVLCTWTWTALFRLAILNKIITITIMQSSNYQFDSTRFENYTFKLLKFNW